jgi:hypothetical protein
VLSCPCGNDAPFARGRGHTTATIAAGAAAAQVEAALEALSTVSDVTVTSAAAGTYAVCVFSVCC